MKRIITFIAVVVITIGVMAWTSPGLIRSINLGLDLKGGFEILYQATPMENGAKITRESLTQTAVSLEKRADVLGGSEPQVTTEGSDRIRLRIAGVTDEQEVRKRLKEPASLTFRSKDGTEKEADQYNKIELIGSDFAENGASITYDQLNRPQISIKLKNKEKFAEVTKRLASKPYGSPERNLAIYLDDRLLSDPEVQQELDQGTAVITGSYTLDEAKQIRDTINLGALPLKLTEKYSQSVGATLGQLSLDQTLKAGAIASIVILLFMILVYHIPGLVASFTLIVYVWMMLLIFYFAGVTLTLPGIAAFVLGIGMAVDANIITDERIKEELRSGKSILSAVKAGNKVSFRTVMDAHVTTFIAAAVMYWMGAGSVRGFALVLMIDIVVSIITNIFFSRYLLVSLVKGNIIKKPGVLGVKESEIRAL
ncbi:protein translocase subunit SecD [Paenibacillus caui]|uniref:protein translocase subunit SecD n=1 Tax=Paenibacillus caui TaxID=2873927 RepID=UPI001CA8122A|nr:protein translocase subunit SecD [Paenibacillus caui]